MMVILIDMFCDTKNQGTYGCKLNTTAQGVVGFSPISVVVRIWGSIFKNI